MKGRYYILCPGIRTDTGDWRNWAPRLATAINLRTEAKADEFRYYALAITPKGKQDERAGYVRDLACMARERGYEPVLVGHSNGCEVIRQALVECSARVHSLHLFAGATHHDFEEGGWSRMLRQGNVGHIYCYVSKGDFVLQYIAKIGAMLGYGRLGYLGPQNVAQNLQSSVTTISRDTYKHGTWFEGENFDLTFAAVTVAERLA